MELVLAVVAVLAWLLGEFILLLAPLDAAAGESVLDGREDRKKKKKRLRSYFLAALLLFLMALIAFNMVNRMGAYQ